ncbi:MAG: hypothetical protein ACRDZO_18780 [Egibacteraceae bacterium]
MTPDSSEVWGETPEGGFERPAFEILGTLDTLALGGGSTLPDGFGALNPNGFIQAPVIIA